MASTAGVLALLALVLLPLVPIIARSLTEVAVGVIAAPVIGGILALALASRADRHSSFAGQFARRTETRVARVLGIIALVIAVPALALLTVTWILFGRSSLDSSCFISYATFVDNAQAGHVSAVQIAGSTASATYTNGDRWLIAIPGDSHQTIDELTRDGVKVTLAAELSNPPTQCSLHQTAPIPLRGG